MYLPNLANEFEKDQHLTLVVFSLASHVLVSLFVNSESVNFAILCVCKKLGHDDPEQRRLNNFTL